MVSFDREANIMPKLRERIEGWDLDVPRLQNSQYGPMNTYLTHKFPNGMVKPQALIREIVADGVMEVMMDNDDEAVLEDIGNISLDSTGIFIPVSVRFSLTRLSGQIVSNQEMKRYPDLVVVSYYRDKPDKIRVVMEIGSVHDRAGATERHKEKVQKQLQEYMVLLGEEGGRWAKPAIGVALVGTEVSFSRRRENKTGGKQWTKPTRWYSIYSQTFVDEMNKIRDAMVGEI
jgi:hypothetical protein